MALARFDGVAPRAGSTVTVYRAGTLDKPDLFEDGDGITLLGNPFTSDRLTGVYVFWTDDVALDVDLDTTDGTPLPTPVSNPLLALSVSGTRPLRTMTLLGRDVELAIVVPLVAVVY